MVTQQATHPDPIQRARRPRGRRTLLLVALVSAGIVLYAVPPYLVPGHVQARVGIRENIAFHLPTLIVHATTSGLALLIGPLQFSRRLRRRSPRLHRIIGRLYLFGGVLPGSLSGMVVALLTTAGPAAMVSFVLLDVAWAATATIAYRAVRQGRYAEHERWMRRNFALTFAAVTLRTWLGLLIGMQVPFLHSVYGGDFGALFDTAYTGAAVLSWAPNLIVIELYLRRRRAAPTV